jgi:hypothetical protein
MATTKGEGSKGVLRWDGTEAQVMLEGSEAEFQNHKSIYYI